MPDTQTIDPDIEMATASPEMFLESMRLELELIGEVFDARISRHYYPQALLERKQYLESYISEFYKWYSDHIKADGPPQERIFEFQWQEIKQKKKELEKITRQAQQRKNKGSDLTDAMIGQAKEYSLDALVEVGRNRMVSCPGHKDKNPSCYIKNNYAYCFSCGRSWDTIQWVMDTEGLNFVDAVRRLQ